MKMTYFLKGLGALIVVAVTWVDSNLSPLFWGLLVLAGIDLFMNLHHSEQQLKKLGAAFFALGLPGFIASNQSHLWAPDTLKVLVAILLIGYVQVLVPQIIALMQKFAAAHPKDAPMVLNAEQIVQEAAKLLQQQAQSQEQKVGIGSANGSGQQ